MIVKKKGRWTDKIIILAYFDVFDVVVVWFSVCDQALDGAREPDQMSLLPRGDQLVT